MDLFSFWQWLLLFYICGFFGWCMESTVVSVQQHRVVNRGFLHGPFIPLYSFGTIALLGMAVPLQKVLDNPFLIYICGILVCTVLEYLTAVSMETLFHQRYWEYDDEKGNYRGRICIKASLFWGGLTLLVVYVLQPLLTVLVNIVPPMWVTGVDIVLSVCFVIDLGWSFRQAFDFQRVEKAMEKAKSELEALDAHTEENGELIVKMKARIEALKAELTERVESVSLHVRSIFHFDADGLPRLRRHKSKDDQASQSEKTEQTE